MTKEEVACLAFNEVSAILSVSFRGAEVSYNKQQKHWRVNARFGINNPIPCRDLEEKFKGTKIHISYSKMSEPSSLSIVKTYTDASPQASRRVNQ
jgi:hypothetical protein